MNEQDVKRIVFQYSEWLDGEGLMASPDDCHDERTHEELVRSFFEEQAD